MSLALVGLTGVIKCSFGNLPTPFVVTPERTVHAELMLMGNITDIVPFKNIEPFGLCSSPLNPAVEAAGGAPMPCVPVTVTPWISGAITVLVQGAPAIDKPAILMCSWAGVIRIIEPGNFTVMVP
jgi:hypothetical protein